MELPRKTNQAAHELAQRYLQIMEKLTWIDALS